MAQSFYEEIDMNGNAGRPGQVKSYDCTMFTAQVEEEAQEEGLSLEEYLQTWWNECSMEIPFTWQTLGSGYGFHGDTIFEQEEPDGGTLRCKEIFDQIMFDVYPPADDSAMAESRNRKSHIITESQLKNIVAESVRRILKEEYEPDIHYTHFAVNKQTNKIVNGWDYSGYDASELKQFAKDYFFQDLADMDLNPKSYKILTRPSLLKRGIDPQDWNNWNQE